MLNRIWIGVLAIFALIVVIVLLVAPGSGTKPSTAKSLPSYANTPTIARLRIDGPIVYDQQHQGIQIDVSNSQVVFEQLNGYNYQVVKQEAFPNNTSAFSNFLYALNYAGFNLGDKSSSLSNVTGRCSDGSRYSFQLLENGSFIQNFWATSCGGTATYKGIVSQTIQLFKAQVPGFDNLTQGINL
ncbi:MAG TPA: hypothetical protein VFN51_02300 [Candidatus Saccharimonadales bacterium]|nr:hypothetical protein [Candidatus Saccharimonadales bacterium]